MPRPYQRVELKDFIVAEEHWYKLYPATAHFRSFLGDDYHRIYDQDGHHVRASKDVAKKIRMLASPHYRTLMQVFIIKTGYHRKIPK